MGFVENLINASHNIELVKKLIGNNALLLNEPDKDGNTALFWACREGKANIVKLLVDARADLNFSNKKEETPLTIASSDGQDVIVRYLLSARADVDKPNKNGWTPLICAAYNGHFKVVELLLSHKADITCTSNVGCSALYWSCNNDQFDIVKLLLDYGADANQPNHVNKTPLMIAARWGRDNIIKVLLENGADKELVDDDGRNAASFAAEYQHNTSIDIINNHVVQVSKRATEKMHKEMEVNMKKLEEIQPLLTTKLTATNPAAPVSSSSTNSNGGGVDSASLNLRLKSLAEASPQVIDFLKNFGNAAYEADQQYQTITKDPSLYEYYITFNKNISGVVVAAQGISSGMVADNRTSNAEQLVNLINSAASATSVFALPLVTSLFALVVKIPNDIDRVRTLKRITTCFPSIDSHKYIEILAREVTMLLAADIRQVLKLAKKHSKASILSMAAKAVEWLRTYDNVTPIQAYANMHSALLLSRMMKHDPPFTVQHTDIPMLIEWATGIDVQTNKSPLMRTGSNLFKSYPPNPSQEVVAAAAPPKAQEEEEQQPVPSPPPVATVEYAEKDLVDERINTLMVKLEKEEAARRQLESQLKEVKELSNKVQRLNALNEIFGGLEEGGLTQSLNKQSIAAAIENHFKTQTAAQNLTDEAVRELVLQVQLIMESMGTSSGGTTPPRSPSPLPAGSPNSNTGGGTSSPHPEPINCRIDDGDVIPPKKTQPGVEKVGGGGCACLIM